MVSNYKVSYHLVRKSTNSANSLNISKFGISSVPATKNPLKQLISGSFYFTKYETQNVII